MNGICVLGSINMDLVLRVDRMVKSGETILAKGFKKVPGGKGANQAVAAKRLGADVHFISKIGNDENGSEILREFKADNMDTKHIKFTEDSPTGMAMITVDDLGSNSIIVIPGANMDIDESDIRNSEDIIKKCKILIAQFETPIKATIKAFQIAKDNGLITILNPAPAKEIPDELLKLTDIVAPNESEVFELTGIKVNDEFSISNAAQRFIEKGVKFVIITLGEKGAALAQEDRLTIIPAEKVTAVDTTAAGDSFIAAVASRLQKEDKIDFQTIENAIKFSNKVSAIVVQRQGAQTSLPYLDEVKRMYKEE